MSDQTPVTPDPDPAEGISPAPEGVGEVAPPAYEPPAAPEYPAAAEAAPAAEVPAPEAAPAAPAQWPAAAPVPPPGAPMPPPGAPMPPPGAPVAPGYPAGGYPPPPETSSNAIIALILAIVSWAVCPVIPAIVALVLASSAAKEIAASGGRKTGSGLVTAARIVSWVNIGVWVAAMVVGLFFFILAIAAGGFSTN